jgi:hypothetical protein
MAVIVRTANLEHPAKMVNQAVMALKVDKGKKVHREIVASTVLLAPVLILIGRSLF